MRDPKERLEDILEAIDNPRLRPGCLAKNRCTQATAAAGSATPRPGESFEAYHPSSIGVICVMIAGRLWAVKPFF
jgi:hypothetical protein